METQPVSVHKNHQCPLTFLMLTLNYVYEETAARKHNCPLLVSEKMQFKTPIFFFLNRFKTTIPLKAASALQAVVVVVVLNQV